MCEDIAPCWQPFASPGPFRGTGERSGASHSSLRSVLWQPFGSSTVTPQAGLITCAHDVGFGFRGRGRVSVKIFSNISQICWLHTPLYRSPDGSIGAHPSVQVCSRLYRHPLSFWSPVCSIGDYSAVLVARRLYWRVCVRACVRHLLGCPHANTPYWSTSDCTGNQWIQMVTSRFQ